MLAGYIIAPVFMVSVVYEPILFHIFLPRDVLLSVFRKLLLILEKILCEESHFKIK